jgi:hypothetical protein
MVRPPFSILFLKRGTHPAVVRITTFRLLLLIVIVLAPWAGTSYLLHTRAGHAPSQQAVTPAPIRESDEPSIPQEPPPAIPMPSPEVAEFSIERESRSGAFDLDCSFTGIPMDESFYLWLIINPAEGETGERVVHPRSPLFHGLPVDYRNGISYSPDDGPASFSLNESVEGIRAEQFRILVFALDGSLLLDRTFNRSGEAILSDSSRQDMYRRVVSRIVCAGNAIHISPDAGSGA